MSSLIEAAESLRPLLRQQAPAIERARRITKEAFAALQEIDAFRLQLTEQFAGPAADPITYLRVIEELSRGDGSSGWCAMVGSESAACVNAYLEPDVAKTIVADRSATVALTVVGSGVASKTSDAYVVTGRWRFASGCRHSTWLSSLCTVHEAGQPVLRDNGVPLTRVIFVRVTDAELHDTWHVSGLRGTASDDFELRNVFVPAEYTFDLADSPLDEAAVWRIPVTLRLAMSKAAAVCGLARGAMDALLPMMARQPFAGSVPSREEPRMQVMLAEAEASLEGGRAYLYRHVEEVWEMAQNRQTLSLADIAKARLAIVFSARSAINSLHLMQEMAGTGAVLDETFDRAARDIEVARHHMQLQTHIVEDVGRVLLGFRPRNPMF